MKNSSYVLSPTVNHTDTTLQYTYNKNGWVMYTIGSEPHSVFTISGNMHVK